MRSHSELNRRTSPSSATDVVLVAGEKPERTTGLNRRQLSPVAGKEDLASGIACRADELIESEGSCQAGLVDDQQLPCP